MRAYVHAKCRGRYSRPYALRRAAHNCWCIPYGICTACVIPCAANLSYEKFSMPATNFLGRRWQVPTDVLPFFAIFGAVIHIVWILYIAIAVFITANVTACDNTGVGRSYLSVVCLFFVLYVVSLFTEILMAVIGLRGKCSLVLRLHLSQGCVKSAQDLSCHPGTPLEASKRRWIQPFLYTQVINWTLQLGMLGMCQHFYPANVGTQAHLSLSSAHMATIDKEHTRCRVHALYLQSGKFGCAGWGTFVVSQLTPEQPCWQDRGRQIVVKVLVYVSWGIIVILNW